MSSRIPAVHPCVFPSLFVDCLRAHEKRLSVLGASADKFIRTDADKIFHRQWGASFDGGIFSCGDRPQVASSEDSYRFPVPR